MRNKLELRDKIYRGIKTALERLISNRAKENDFLIVSREGKIEKIPAQKLKQN